MKIVSALSGMFLMLAISGTVQAQKLKLTEGNIDAVKSETSLNFEFAYVNMKVGKFDNEQDYIDKKKADYNKKEEGKGDTWAKA
ncbi:hypothetical protein INO78_13505, partial [Staphylococcus aureus]|nr:hypothetical protein [Staphylococcus aureus]